MFRGAIEPEMVHVPAGPFLMGTSDEQIDWLARHLDVAKTWRDKGYFCREQPLHCVTLPDYCIGKYPVTMGEYRAFVEACGYLHPPYWTAAGWAWREAYGKTEPDQWQGGNWMGDDRLPVVGVSWYEAAAYCRWLSEATGRDYRLPTEAEWEKAARGTDGRLYPWGDAFDASRCNTRASGLDRTTPVGAYSPAGDSPSGCADIAGNVSEWMVSLFRPYPYDAADGRDEAMGRQPVGDGERVLRGGSWHSPVLRARTVSRGMNDPTFTDRDVGFRCMTPCPCQEDQRA
jgi:formylglycine-generating enzyme required for sulfatase activity